MRLLADHCNLYNAALEERREAWRMRKVSVSYAMQSAQLKDIRKADPKGQGRHLFTAQQQTLHRLSTVFGAFYDRCKVGKTAGYPRFKPNSRFNQVRFVAGDGAKWTPAEVGGWARAHFQAIGSVKVKQHRTVPGTVKALQIKREHRRWYVIVMSLWASVKMVGSTHRLRSNRRPAGTPRHRTRWRLRPGWFRRSKGAGRAPRPR